MRDRQKLKWIDGRWNLDGRPIHAGTPMDVCWPDGTWQQVRIESADAGRKLLACFDYHGLDLSIRVDDQHLRWP